MDISKRIEALRVCMRKKNIDMYYIPSNDFHSSEYVGDFFKCREFISGFDGSAGTVIVTLGGAGLWTDGRYFLQAEEQLKGSGITLYKSGMEGVPKIKDYIEANIPESGVLGCDGRVVPASWAEDMEECLAAKGAELDSSLDLVGNIWQDRPVIASKPAWLLDVCYAGKTREEKIARLREYMDEYQADYHIITSLDDIAWLLNIRGNDIHCSPVVLSYLIAGKDSIILFADRKSFGSKEEKALAAAGVLFMDYGDIYA